MIRYCAYCPVADACDQAAVDGDEPGLWGGRWHSRDEHRQHQTTDLLQRTTTEVAA